MKKGIDKIVSSLSPEDLPTFGTDNALADIKSKALHFLNNQGFPDARDEEYKYTYLTRVLSKQLSSVADLTGKVYSVASFKKPFEINNAIEIEVIDGEVQTIPSIKAKGIEIFDFKNASEKQQDFLKENIGKQSSEAIDSFSKLNDLLVADGLAIIVKANKIIEQPVVVYHLSTGKTKKISAPRIFTHIAHHAQAEIIEVFESVGGESNITNHTLEAVLEDGSHLNYSKIQANLDGNTHIGNAYITQVSNSVFTINTFTMSGDLVRNNMKIAVNGSNAEANMNGLYLPNGDTHIDNHTVVDHTTPHSESNQLYKGILTGKGTGVFNGKIYVRQKAQKTNAFQSNKNIVLSNNANIYTKPQLEIWADDVKCSHGCTSGKLDKDALFYLQARGLSKEDAKSYLLIAFAQDTFNAIKHEPLLNYLNAKIVEKLSH